MKFAIKIFAVILIVAVTLALIMLGSSAFAASSGHFTCLVAGLDDAAENTDVLSVVDFDFSLDAVKVYQIPRDTYFNFGTAQNKINQLFPAFRSGGASKHRAMRSLTERLEEQLAVKLDGYIAITADAFKGAVAFLGGIYVDAEDEVELLSNDGRVLLHLNIGENLLSADQAFLLARYRSGYARADLDRLDAQKLLINGFYKTVMRKGGYKALASMMLSLDGVTSNISLTKIVRLIGDTPDISGMTVTSVTMPGKALADSNGIWYYCLNRRRTVEQLRNIPTFDEEGFDKNRLFLKSDDKIFSKVYND